ncbi:hypothetical protein BD779DRAFT_1671145 [Infundibulicybe gibba]|nr:hypothetical protein BD779DRAFT_1671145 [Infundibulicybe gibba]
MGYRVCFRQPDPGQGAGPPFLGQDSFSLTADQSRVLQTAQLNLTLWTNRKYAVVTIIIFAIMVAGIVIGVIADVHTAVSPSNNSPSICAHPNRPYDRVPILILDTSSWIWLGATLAAEPAGDWAFRKTLSTSTTPAKEAVVLLTIDDTFILYHNSQLIAANVNQLTGQVRRQFAPILILIPMSYAGLLASIQIAYADGTTAIISSDATWRTAQPIPDGFQSPSFDDAQWQSASTLAKYGSYPWGDQVVIPQGFNFTAR